MHVFKRPCRQENMRRKINFNLFAEYFSYFSYEKLSPWGPNSSQLAEARPEGYCDVNNQKVKFLCEKLMLPELEIIGVSSIMAQNVQISELNKGELVSMCRGHESLVKKCFCVRVQMNVFYSKGKVTTSTPQ